MLQPAYCCTCNLHVAAPSTCMLLHLQPTCCCTCNLHVAAGIYRQPSMSAVSTLPFERLSDYVDAPKPTQEQLHQYFNMQKSSTSVIIMKQDYLHVQHNQPAGFTTLGPTLALCFSKCADSGDEILSTNRRKFAEVKCVAVDSRPINSELFLFICIRKR
jgi:hypothetical protein